MKNQIKYTLAITSLLITTPAWATDLLNVYQDAMKNDQTYANAMATARAAAEQSPMALSTLLPQIVFTSKGELSREESMGNTTNSAGNIVRIDTTTRERNFNYTLSLTQPIFNFSSWANLASAHDAVKSAYATLSYAKQDLMARATSAYLQVLEDEDVLRYAKANERSLKQKYQQADESFKVGTKTITDVYQAKAAYDGAVSAGISAKNQLQTDIESLSVITNRHYRSLSTLSTKMPLNKPNPASINAWVDSTQQHNWQAIAAKYDMLAAKQKIRQERGNHLPTLSASADYSRQLTHTMGGGTSTTKGPSGSLNLTFPIFNAGAGTSTLTTAAVEQAIANYDATSSTYRLTLRQQIQAARTAYLSVVSDISQVEADENTIQSDRSALKGTEEGYKVGTQTMLDVLDAEQKLYSDLKQYAADRYNYLNNAITLKEAAGTLSATDLAAINSWLTPAPKQSNAFDTSDINSLKKQPSKK